MLRLFFKNNLEWIEYPLAMGDNRNQQHKTTKVDLQYV